MNEYTMTQNAIGMVRIIDNNQPTYDATNGRIIIPLKIKI